MCCSVRAQAKRQVPLQMLYLRYAVGGQAELSAADTLALDDMASRQEGGPAVKVNIARVVHEYLIDAMREVKVDEASLDEVNAEAEQGQGSGMRQCCSSESFQQSQGCSYAAALDTCSRGVCIASGALTIEHSTFWGLQAVIAGAVQHCAELRTARGSKAPPAGSKKKCSCCALQ